MQKQGSDRLEEVLKAQLGNAEQAVPEALWAVLEEELFPEKKRRFFIWWWFLLAELVAIAIIVPIKTDAPGKDPATQVFAKRGVSGRNFASPIVSAKTNENQPISYEGKTYNETTHLTGNGRSTIAVHSTSFSSQSRTDGIKSGRTVQQHHSGKPADRSAANESAISIASGKSDEKQTPENLTGKAEENSRTTAQNPASDSTASTREIDTLPLRNPEAPIASLILQNTFENRRKAEKPGPWKIGLSGGYDFFSQTVFANYLETGQLSHSAYQSQGYELSLNVGRKVLPWLSVELFGAYNKKKSGYVYDILVDRQVYFQNVMTGESLDLFQVSSASPQNCYYLRNATASYTLDSWLTGLNIDMETTLRKRLGLYGGIGGLANISTAMHDLKAEKLILHAPDKEKFSYLQFQASCGLSWKLSNYLSWRLGATYRTQVTNKSEFLWNQRSILLNTGISVLLKTKK